MKKVIISLIFILICIQSTKSINGEILKFITFYSLDTIIVSSNQILQVDKYYFEFTDDVKEQLDTVRLESAYLYRSNENQWININLIPNVSYATNYIPLFFTDKRKLTFKENKVRYWGYIMMEEAYFRGLVSNQVWESPCGGGFECAESYYKKKIPSQPRRICDLMID